jgi:hypothetical protein
MTRVRFLVVSQTTPRQFPQRTHTRLAMVDRLAILEA